MDDIDISSLQNDFAIVDMLSRPSLGSGPFPMLEQLLLKKGEIKLKMYQEQGHGRPHFHVDYGKEIHTASYAIETGERIEGSLNRKYDRTVGEWAAANRDKLMNVWNALQKGQPEQDLILALGTMNS